MNKHKEASSWTKGTQKRLETSTHRLGRVYSEKWVGKWWFRRTSRYISGIRGSCARACLHFTLTGSLLASMGASFGMELHAIVGSLLSCLRSCPLLFFSQNLAGLQFNLRLPVRPVKQQQSWAFFFFRILWWHKKWFSFWCGLERFYIFRCCQKWQQYSHKYLITTFNKKFYD